MNAQRVAVQDEELFARACEFVDEAHNAESIGSAEDASLYRRLARFCLLCCVNSTRRLIWLVELGLAEPVDGR